MKYDKTDLASRNIYNLLMQIHYNRCGKCCIDNIYKELGKVIYSIYNTYGTLYINRIEEKMYVSHKINIKK